MSKTVDELVNVYCKAFYAQRDKAPEKGITEADRAGIIAVVTALRDEFPFANDHCGVCSSNRLIWSKILGPAGDEVVGETDRVIFGMSVSRIDAGGNVTRIDPAEMYEAPATAPAPADRKHPSHETRISFDASSYDEICVRCGVTDRIGRWGKLAEPCSNPAPAVCEWEGGGNAWLSTCGTVWDIFFKDYSFGCCPSCGKPIAFKGA